MELKMIIYDIVLQLIYYESKANVIAVVPPLGIVNDTMVVYYRARYKSSKDEFKVIIVT